MALAPGTRIGIYEVTLALGVGGMGEVYRARDSKLKREVALKVLPPELAGDRERLARFQREAEVLASLNHPHIAQIYGIEESAPGATGPSRTTALVMELVEGDDLAQRIARGAIPLDEALPIARQIAEALEAAHEQGIIHRDLKPANIKVRPDGTVKVLDFGLAKALDSGNSHTRGEPPNSPTITSPAMTMHGMILGTAAYMAPEQARSKPVDKRADIWAFGCVLYEMLTGCKAFDGADLTDTLVSVVSREPDWSQLPAVTPPAIGRLLRRCMVKDRRSRLPDIAVARLDIDEALTAPARVDLPAPVSPVRGPAPWREGVAWATAAVSVAAALAVVTTRRTPALPPPTPLRFAVDPADGVRFYVRTPNFFAVSSDGHHLAYIGQDDAGTRALWLHSFREGTARLLANTTGAGNAFWSRDGRFIAFQAGGKLRKVEIVSGAIQTICDLTDGAGLGTWNRDDVILISDRALYRVSAQGGTPQAITRLDEGRGDVLHTRPHFLPDGRQFLFSAVNRQLGKSALRMGELGSTETRDLGVITSGAEYVAPGYLVYAVGARLIARPFDAAAGDWAGEPTVLSERVRQQTVGRAAFSASPNGVLVFDDSTLSGQDVNLMWVNRDGTAPRTFAAIHGVHAISLASNDQVAAVELISGSSGSGVWLLDSRRGTRTRLTFESGTSQGHPVWSPDRTRVVYFDGQPSVTSRLLVKAVTGTREAEPLVPSAADTTEKQATDWSADGRIVLFEENSPATGWDLRYVRLDRDRTASAVLQSRFAERQGQLSPDGRYLAYVSDESGQDEIYVTTFPGAAEKWAISSRGGTTPRWRRDGRELLFIDPEGTLQSVAILTGARFQADVPKPQFALNPIATDGWSYAISQDGRRLLVAQPAQAERSRSIVVLTNWPHRMPAPR